MLRKAHMVTVRLEENPGIMEDAPGEARLSRMTSLPPSRPKRMYLSWQPSTSSARRARLRTSTPLKVSQRACAPQRAAHRVMAKHSSVASDLFFSNKERGLLRCCSEKQHGTSVVC